MPNKLARPCKYKGCALLTNDAAGYCPAHKSIMQHQSDAQRGTSTQRGYDYRWQQNRLFYLQQHPLCAECERLGLIMQATTVDHIIPHRGDYNLMWSPNNWQALCIQHHNFKTAAQDGAFGNVETRDRGI